MYASCSLEKQGTADTVDVGTSGAEDVVDIGILGADEVVDIGTVSDICVSCP